MLVEDTIVTLNELLPVTTGIVGNELEGMVKVIGKVLFPVATVVVMDPDTVDGGGVNVNGNVLFPVASVIVVALGLVSVASVEVLLVWKVATMDVVVVPSVVDDDVVLDLILYP